MTSLRKGLVRSAAAICQRTSRYTNFQGYKCVSNITSKKLSDPTHTEPENHVDECRTERAATKTKDFTNGYQSISALEHVNRRFQATYQY